MESSPTSSGNKEWQRQLCPVAISNDFGQTNPSDASSSGIGDNSYSNSNSNSNTQNPTTLAIRLAHGGKESLRFGHPKNWWTSGDLEFDLDGDAYSIANVNANVTNGDYGSSSSSSNINININININDYEFSEYRKGLVSTVGLWSGLVLGWLVLLALLGVAASRIAPSGSDGSTTVPVLPGSDGELEGDDDYDNGRQKPRHNDSDNEAEEGEAEDEDEDEEQVLRMECASAASPRWLSFPKTSPLTRVTSFFTNTSLASLASSDDDDDGDEGDDEGDLEGEERRRRTDSSNNTEDRQLYRLGVVRDGKLEMTHEQQQKQRQQQQQQQQRSDDAESSLAASSVVPWEDLVLDLYQDLWGCETADRKNNDRRRRRARSTESTYSDTGGTEWTGESAAATISIGSLHSNSNTNSNSIGSNKDHDAAHAIPNDDDILRDLQQLEQERRLLTTNPGNNTDQNNNNNHNNNPEDDSSSSAVARVNGVPVTASMLSSLLTTILSRQQEQEQEQEQQGGVEGSKHKQDKADSKVLLGEGDEIWYDARAKTLLRNDGSGGAGAGGDNNDSVGKKNKKNEKKIKKKKTRRAGRRPLRSGSSLLSAVTEEDDECQNKDDDPKTTEQKEGRRRRQNDKRRYRCGACRCIKRILFLASGVCIVATSCALAVVGTRLLADAFESSTDALERAQVLALEGIADLEQYDNYNGTQIANDLEDAVRDLVRTTNAACDLTLDPVKEDDSGSFANALHKLVDLWNSNSNNRENNENDDDNTEANENKKQRLGILRQQGIIVADDLRSVVDATSSLDDRLAEYQWVVPTLLACNILLAIVVSILLVDATLFQRRRRRQRLRQTNNAPASASAEGPPVVVLSLFVTLAIIAFCCSVAFGLGSTVGADLCAQGSSGPDRAVLRWLEAQKLTQRAADSPEEEPIIIGNERGSEDDRFYDLAIHAIRHCPRQQEQQQAAAVVVASHNWNHRWEDEGWEFVRASWEVGTLASLAANDDYDRASIRDICVVGSSSSTNGIDDLAFAGGQLADVSCEASVRMRELLEVSRCENWYPLYEAGMHDALCSSGVSGFVWITIAQAVVVILSLIMLTVREGYFDRWNHHNFDQNHNRSDPIFKNKDGATTQNTTMATDADDEDDGRSTNWNSNSVLGFEPRELVGEDKGEGNNNNNSNISTSRNSSRNSNERWFDWEQPDPERINIDFDVGSGKTGSSTTTTYDRTRTNTLSSIRNSKKKALFGSYRNVDHTGMIRNGGGPPVASVNGIETHHSSPPLLRGSRSRNHQDHLTFGDDLSINSSDSSDSSNSSNSSNRDEHEHDRYSGTAFGFDFYTEE